MRNHYSWSLGGRFVDTSDLGEIATTRERAPGVWSVQSTCSPAQEPEPAESFLDVLREWGHTWLWDDLRLVGDTGWLADAIGDGTLVAVTDSSYIKEMYPNLC